MKYHLAINGGSPVAQWEASRWPVSGMEEERRLLQVLHDGPWAGNGPMETGFSEAWASFCGSRFCLLTTVGTAALQLALEALDIGFVDEVLAARVDSLRNCGRVSPLLPAERQSPPGSGNYRMTEWQAAVLLAQLERLPEQVDRREKAAAVLDDRLAELPGVAPLRRHPAITRQSYYAYGFQFIPELWEGIS